MTAMEDIKHPNEGNTSNDQTAPFYLTEVDRAILAQTDDEFVPHSWEELKEIVGMLTTTSIGRVLLLSTDG